MTEEIIEPLSDFNSFKLCNLIKNINIGSVAGTSVMYKNKDMIDLM